MVGRGDGGRLGETLMGGSHLEVRGREGGGGRLDWAGVGPTGACGKKGKRGREGGGLGLKKKESFVCFFNSNTI